MVSPRLGQMATFARLPHDADPTDVDVAFDDATTCRAGARVGLSAIREQSRLLQPYSMNVDVSPLKNTSGILLVDERTNATTTPRSGRWVSNGPLEPFFITATGRHGHGRLLSCLLSCLNLLRFHYSVKSRAAR